MTLSMLNWNCTVVVVVILTALLIVQSASSRQEGPTIHLLYTLGVSLNELSSAVSCMGWERLSNMDDSLTIILLSPNTCTVSRGASRTQAAFLLSLSNLFLSVIDMLLLQQTTPEEMVDATKVLKKVLGSAALQGTLVFSEDRTCSDP